MSGFSVSAARAALLVSLLGAVLTGCSSGSGQPPPNGAGARIGVPLRLADCTDWENADTAERLGTITVLRDFASGPTGTPGSYGRTIHDEQAYRLLQGYCSANLARGFKLYHLYNRAAAFQSIKDKYFPNR